MHRQHALHAEVRLNILCRPFGMHGTMSRERALRTHYLYDPWLTGQDSLLPYSVLAADSGTTFGMLSRQCGLYFRLIAKLPHMELWINEHRDGHVS